MRGLRPYQARAIDDTRRAIGDGARRVCLQLPTGGGKTVIAAGIVNAALAKGRRVLFTVPAIALVDQTVERFRESGIDEIGVIQSDHWMTDWSKPVQVASVQTLQRRWAEGKFPRSDLVIVDEAHKLFQLYGQWFGHADWQRVPVIGLSATPWAKGMSALYDRLLIGSTVGEMTGAGYLSPAVYYGPSHPDLSSAKIVAGDYREADAEAAMSPLTADVVSTWLRLGEDRATILFAVNRAHARALQRQFEAAGVGASVGVVKVRAATYLPVLPAMPIAIVEVPRLVSVQILISVIFCPAGLRKQNSVSPFAMATPETFEAR